MARTGNGESFANSTFTAAASSSLVVVSTTIDPPWPTIKVTLAIESPTAT
jgi:hypothetical protein